MPLAKSLPTANNSNANGYTFYGAVTIECPASTAWDVLLDFPRYPEWNTVAPEVKFPSSPSRPQPNEDGTLTVRYAPSDEALHPNSIRLIHIDDATRTIQWQGTVTPKWILHPERVQQVKDLGDGRCEYVTYETMQGPASHVVNWMMGAKLEVMNVQMGKDLKEWIESGRYASS